VDVDINISNFTSKNAHREIVLYIRAFEY